ncbi:hypothetical protein [Singulisphaera sp. PoT]|uniref:hypothetical protein n=1 Tax=Singulisphaera sp. PoT TaxID=3411797 RepID=UPI003BF50028
MAVKKAAGGSKKQEAPATKAKAGAVKSAAKKETAPKKSTTAAAPKAAAPKAAPKAAATPKAPAAPKAAAAPKATVKKAAPKPIKLSASQTELLKKIGGTTEPGYVAEKKAEQKTIDALLERKLVKKGSKNKEKGTYHHLISTAGKKHLETASAAEAAKASTPSGS